MENVNTLILDEYEQMVHVGTSSVIGRRQYQQDAVKTDSFYSYLDNGKMIAVLCDGMGGMNSGEKASATCVNTVFNAFHANIDRLNSIPAFYIEAIRLADDCVCNMKKDDGSTIVGAGTTFASIIIDDDKLYWASVGDSHIYIVRNNQITCLTRDHNYLMILREKVKRGEMTEEEAQAEPKKEALISYIGVGGVRITDINERAVQLMDNDKIIICSDGLYRSITSEEMKAVVTKHGKETQLAAEELTALALTKNLKNQDNTTAIVICFQKK